MAEGDNRAAIAELFNDALDCFEYIQFGTGFNTDLQPSVLRLDSARLRLSRWGAAVGLSGETENFRRSQLSRSDSRDAENSLRTLLGMFSSAQKYFQENAGHSKPELMDVQRNMDPVGQSLHKKMRSMALQRRNDASLMRKEGWALRTVADLEKFLGGIVKQIDNVVSTFPGTQQMQKDLCAREVSELGTTKGINMLRGIIENMDKDLKDALSKPGDPKNNAAQTWNNYNISKQVVITGVINGHLYQNSSGEQHNSLHDIHNTFQGQI